MLIRTKITASIIFAVVLAVVLCLFTWRQLVVYSTQQDNLRQIQMLAKNASLLSTLAYEHFINDSERVAQQYRTVYQQSQELVAGLEGFMPLQWPCLLKIREGMVELDKVYQKMSGENFTSSATLEKEGSIPFLLRKKVVTQFVSTSERIQDCAYSLIDRYRQQVKSQWRIVLLLLGFCFASLFLALIWLTRLIVGSVLVPLKILQHNANILRHGNESKETFIEPKKMDELGEFAIAFNEMSREVNLSWDKLEKLIQLRTRDLERSNRDLQQFAYAASHDLQEPLRTISGYLSLLEERYSDVFSEDDKRFIVRPREAAGRMKEMINGLLSMSRLETHGDPFQQVDCTSVVQDCCRDLERLIAETGAEIHFGELPTISGDTHQLRQLFTNLLTNAIKFRGENRPEITIRVEPIEEEKKGYLFAVTDNGIGFEQEFAEKIFVIFQRLHGRSEYKGSGIGLSLCKKIVERHGGTIWAESAPGKGTTFFFTLFLDE